MHLTYFSDYALRVAIYLAASTDGSASVERISRSFGISRHHLAKVVRRMTELGVVASTRGRGGGVRLARPASEINVGWLVRQTEPHLDVVECFDQATNTCPIAGACGLRVALYRAREAFLDVLDGYDINQFMDRRVELVSILGATPGRADDEASPP